MLCLSNGILSIVRINAMFPIYDDMEVHITFAIESACFFGATWLFASKYYETAKDVERVMQIKQS